MGEDICKWHIQYRVNIQKIERNHTIQYQKNWNNMIKIWSSPGWVAQLVKVSLCTPKICGLIPSQGTYLGCGFIPWLGCMQEATNRCFFLTSLFLSFSFPFPPRFPHSKINKHILTAYFMTEIWHVLFPFTFFNPCTLATIIVLCIYESVSVLFCLFICFVFKFHLQVKSYSICPCMSYFTLPNTL